MFADMHIHSCSSDGTWDIEEILEIVIKKHITLFSIIDHDILDSTINVKKLLSEFKGTYIHGAEITSGYQGITYHIACYNFNCENKALNKLLKENVAIWENFNNEFIRVFAETNPIINKIEHDSYEHTPERGGWKTLNYLLDKNVITEIPEFFKIAEPLTSLLKYPSPEKIIKVVKSSGGTPFLAHPNAYNKGKPLPEEKLKQWIDFGISGIEAYSPYCKKEDSVYYAEFCKRNNLQISGGSDCHGNLLLTRSIGSPVITKDMLKLDFI